MLYRVGPPRHPNIFEETKAYLEFNPFEEVNFEFEPWEFITEAVVQELDQKAKFLNESKTAPYPIIEGKVVNERIYAYGRYPVVLSQAGVPSLDAI